MFIALYPQTIGSLAGTSSKLQGQVDEGKRLYVKILFFKFVLYLLTMP